MASPKTKQHNGKKAQATTQQQVSASVAVAAAQGTLGPNAGILPPNNTGVPQQTRQNSQYGQQYGGQWPLQTGAAAQSAPGRPYPQMPEVPPDKPLLLQMGAPGTAIFAGIITSEEYNPDWYWREGVKIVEQMVRNDATVKSTRDAVEKPILSAKPVIEPGSDSERDTLIASFVESCLLEGMYYETTDGRKLCQKWDEVLRHILMHIWYGFMAFETVWKVEDGWVKWARWTPLLPRTVWRWWVGPDAELTGIQQYTWKDYSFQYVNIPADKLLLFSHQREGNNFEGVSALRTAYKHWYFKDQFYNIEAIAAERNSVPPPVLKLPPGFSTNDIAQAQQIVANIRVNEQGGITLPPGWELDYPRMNERQSFQLKDAIVHHDIQIMRNMLAHFIANGSLENGSRAMDKSQARFFLASLQSICEYIEDVINHDAIVRLVDYNFDNVDVYPKLKFPKLVAQDIEGIAQALQLLGSEGFIHPDPELEDFIRDAYGLPGAPQSVIEAYNPTAPSTPSRPENDNAGAHGDQDSRSDNASGGNGATGDTSGDGGGGDGGSGLADVAREMRLLTEAMRSIDAVDRGLAHYALTTDAHGHEHVPKGQPGAGQFANTGGRKPSSSGSGGSRAGGSGGAGESGKSEGGAKTSGGRGSRGGGEAAAHHHQELLHQGYRDWVSGRAHLDRAGKNYRIDNVDSEGHRIAGSKVAPWNRAVKSTHTVDEFHRAAHAYVDAHPGTTLRGAGTRSRGTKSAPAEHEAKAEKAEKAPRAGSRGTKSEESLRAELARVEARAAQLTPIYDAKGHLKSRVPGKTPEWVAAQRGRAQTRAANIRAELAARTAPSTKSATAKSEHEAKAGKASGGGTKAKSGSGGKSGEAAKAEGAGKSGTKAAGGTKAKSGNGTRATHTDLAPIAHVGRHEANPGSAPNAHYLRALYGDHQLHAALDRYSHADLREAARFVGVKGGRTREETIQRIMRHVTQVPYEETLAQQRATADK